MQPANRLTLEQYRSFYTSWVNDKVFYGLDGAAKDNIQRIIREEWEPGYICQMYCGHCVAEMLVKAFENMDREMTQAAPPVDVVKIKLRE